MTVWNDEELRKIRYPVYDELTEKLARWLLEQREIARRTQLQLDKTEELRRAAEDEVKRLRKMMEDQQKYADLQIEEMRKVIVEAHLDDYGTGVPCTCKYCVKA